MKAVESLGNGKFFFKESVSTVEHYHYVFTLLLSLT